MRKRLTVLLALGFAALMLGVGLFVSRAVHRMVIDEFDEALLARARTLVALTEEESGRIELDYSADRMPEFERSENPDYFEFWLDDGTVLLRSRRLVKDLPRLASPADPASPRDVVLPDGRAGRLVEWAFVPRGAGEPKPAVDDGPSREEIGSTQGKHGVVLAVARGRESIDARLAAVDFAAFGAVVLAAALAGLFVWRTLAAGFRPVESMARQVERLDAEGLDARVVVPNVPRELAPVVEQLNALLGRLAASFARERRFAGNVAHELRTPIAELRSLATVGARWPDDAPTVARFFEDVGEVAKRMEALVHDLLLLARCNAGAEHATSVSTSLRAAVEAAWAPLADRARTAGLSFRVEAPEDLRLATDPGKWSIVLSNLLENAVAYARPGGAIVLRAARAGPRCRLELTNEADRLSPDDLARLTEPFWRKDDARASAEHAGLGLSLVSALAPLLKIDVRFDQDDDGTFRVRLDAPAADDRRVEPVSVLS